MNRPVLRRLALLAALLASACQQAPDLTAVQRARQRPVQPFDLLQAVAGNGRVQVAAGAGGSLWTSADAGRTWARRQLPMPASLIALAACPDGRFVGIDFYRQAWFADAAAQHWTARPLAGAVQPMAVTCDPLGRAWVVGSNATLLVSDDRGEHWQSQALDEDTLLTTVQFVDAQRGVVTGEFGTVLTTDDGGRRWQRRPQSRPDFYPYATVFIDAQRGWSAGVAGVVLATDDGGTTWREAPNRTGAALYRLAARDGRLLAVGSGGTLAQWADGAWQRIAFDSPTGAFLTDLALDADGTVTLTGAAGTLRRIPVAPAAGPRADTALQNK